MGVLDGKRICVTGTLSLGRKEVEADRRQGTAHTPRSSRPSGAVPAAKKGTHACSAAGQASPVPESAQKGAQHSDARHPGTSAAGAQ
jgi:hypothetical protein